MEKISDEQFERSLDKYKQFIDDFLQFKDYIAVSNFRRGLPVAPPFLAELISKTPPQEQETLLKALQNAYESGMHYALFAVEGYRVADAEGELLLDRPYGSRFSFDWRSRVDGLSWAYMDGGDEDIPISTDEDNENKDDDKL